ncbi:MAG: hypothetical protein RML40_10010 [Bacteroidota bacterium]|nr:hypothetical protein [Candidatus Kapabacteria bacterium]MDW8220853.1 hypothetical protein [Bacteroidota bacterium]
MRRYYTLASAVCLVVIVGACATGTDTGTTTNQQQDPTGGLVGTWISSSENVAPLLKTLLAVDSIVANFNAQGGYSVTSYSARNGNQTFTGTYTVTRSMRDTLSAPIYAIDLRQATPTVLRSQGIYVVQTSMSPARMLYEVVQTEPPGGIAPTPAGGFGSSKNVMGVPLTGMFSNIQVYRKRS